MLDLVCHVNFVQQRFVLLVFCNGATVTPFFVFVVACLFITFFFVFFFGAIINYSWRLECDKQESDPICQAFLQANLPEQCHIIPDLFARFEGLGQFDRPSRFLMQFPQQEQIKRLRTYVVCDRVVCVKHRQWCKCRKYWSRASFLSNDLEVTGTPCQDYSPMGSRNGIFGKQFLIFLAWAKVCKHQRPKVIVHENVHQFPVTLLHEYFSDDYWIFRIETDAQDLGLYAMARPRSYAIMYDKNQVNVLTNPSELFAHLS